MNYLTNLGLIYSSKNVSPTSDRECKNLPNEICFLFVLYENILHNSEYMLSLISLGDQTLLNDFLSVTNYMVNSPSTRRDISYAKLSLIICFLLLSHPNICFFLNKVKPNGLVTILDVAKIFLKTNLRKTLQTDIYKLVYCF